MTPHVCEARKKKRDTNRNYWLTAVDFIFHWRCFISHSKLKGAWFQVYNAQTFDHINVSLELRKLLKWEAKKCQKLSDDCKSQETNKLNAKAFLQEILNAWMSKFQTKMLWSTITRICVENIYACTKTLKQWSR